MGLKNIQASDRSAGCNQVTVYNHFHDKSTLVREVVKKAATEQWSQISAILQGEQSFLERLERIVTTKIELAQFEDSTLLASALREDAATREMVQRMFEEEVNPAFLEFLSEGQKNGVMRNDLSLASLQIYLDMFTGLARTHPELFAERERMAPTTREVWSLFLHGLLGTAPAEP